MSEIDPPIPVGNGSENGSTNGGGPPMPPLQSRPARTPPAFASPIVDVSTAPPDGSGVMLGDLSHLTKVLVRVTATSGTPLGPFFGSSEVRGDALVCGTRPQEWTVIGDNPSVADVLEQADGYFVDITHARALVEVAGPEAARTLEKVCSVDWSDRMTPDGAVLSASVAKVTCDVIRRDRNGSAVYFLMTDRSYGQYLFDALADATTEFVTG
ncbi:MAG: hypothetical protein AAF467_12625 [Actinomycetota bacterium]